MDENEDELRHFKPSEYCRRYKKTNTVGWISVELHLLLCLPVKLQNRTSWASLSRTVNTPLVTLSLMAGHTLASIWSYLIIAAVLFVFFWIQVPIFLITYPFDKTRFYAGRWFRLS